MTKNQVIKIFHKYGVDFREAGKNIRKGNVAVNCPFCGDDTGYHLGILFPNGNFTCWKNKSHSGSFLKLLMKLCRMSYVEARDILQIDALSEDIDVSSIFQKEEVKEEKKQLSELTFYPEFRVPEIGSKYTSIYYKYLLKRGFPDARDIIYRYNIKCSLIGDFSHRIVFPVYMHNRLVSWQGRSILKNPYLRYKDLEPSKSIIPLKDTLFNFDICNIGNEYLFITEGIFDALKIIEFGFQNCYATCLYTLSISDAQVLLISRLATKYKKMIIVLDKNAELAAINVRNKLSFLRNIDLIFTPSPFKDLGEMNESQIKIFLKEIL